MAFVQYKSLLVGYGLFAYLACLILGGFLMRFRNPRMALSAHVTGLIVGTFSMALAAISADIDLQGWMAPAAIWSHMLGNSLLVLALLFAAGFGTSDSTPIAGAGYSGAPWAESLARYGIRFSSALVILSSCLILVGWWRSLK